MSNTDNVFHNIFQEKQNKSKNKVEEFLKDPGTRQIHDLRTSIRRLEAAYLIFPKSCKRKKTDSFVSSYKSLFKKNSSIRDSDVIIGELLRNGLTDNSKIIKTVIKQKNKKLKSVLKNAKKISKLKFVELENTSTEKIIKKYEKIIYSLITKIQKYIPIVISDESKIKELHSMRKTAKKLRYILEVEPNHSYQHIIDNMKSFQELLGKIHDCDITVEHLKKYSKKNSEVKSLILKESKIRSEMYNKLADSLSINTAQEQS